MSSLNRFFEEEECVFIQVGDVLYQGEVESTNELFITLKEANQYALDGEGSYNLTPIQNSKVRIPWDKVTMACQDDCQFEEDEDEDLGKKVIIRTYAAGVHYGVLSKKTGMEVVLTQAKRIWSWDGAATLSQLAMEGTKKPDVCKFSMPVDSITLKAIEIIPCRQKACQIIEGIEWKA